VRVVIADDNLLLRQGLAALLRECGVEVAGEASSADELVREVDAHEPDVAIVDIRCRPRTPTRGCMRRAGSASATRASAS
jgi:DNA-binding NarL/FixJ family response regulator